MDKDLAQLETLLQQQIVAHEQLAGLVQRKLAALRRADPRDVATCCELENQCVQAIGELEKRRLQVVADLTLAVLPNAPAPLNLGELAQRLAEPARGKLLVLRQQLRQRMEQVQRDSTVARLAADALVKHMHGLVQGIAASITGVSVYGRAGVLPRAAAGVSTFSATA